MSVMIMTKNQTVAEVKTKGEDKKSKDANPMRQIRIGKVVINIGVKDPIAEVEKAYRLLEKITGKKPVKTKATRKARTFGIRRGLPIGVKVTIRGGGAEELAEKLLEAVDKKLKITSFDNEGNVNFGIKEYLDIPGVKYDPTIGIFGMDVAIQLERPGFRVKRRRLGRARIGKHHRIRREEAIRFMKERFGIEVVEER